MQTVSITAPQQVSLVERPDPRAAQDLVVVRIEVAPMCTEYKAYKEGRKSDFLGHEAAGVVEAVAQPGRVQVGDRVVVMPQYACGKCELCLSGEYIHCEQSIDVAAITGSRWGTATLRSDW